MLLMFISLEDFPLSLQKLKSGCNPAANPQLRKKITFKAPQATHNNSKVSGNNWLQKVESKFHQLLLNEAFNFNCSSGVKMTPAHQKHGHTKYEGWEPTQPLPATHSATLQGFSTHVCSLNSFMWETFWLDVNLSLHLLTLNRNYMELVSKTAAKWGESYMFDWEGWD